MSILKLKDSQGNWVGVPTVKGDTGNGIQSAVLNNDYTLTLTFTDGTTYTTPSIRGEKGEQGEPATDMDIHICSASEYDSETRIPTIANPNDKTFYLVPTEDGTSPDLFTEWVYVDDAWEMFGSMKIDLSGYLTDVTVDGTSVVTDGVAEIPIANNFDFGLVKIGTGIGMSDGKLNLLLPAATDIKSGLGTTNALFPLTQHHSTFYGLAKVAGHDEKDSTLPVGQYTDEAKSSIQDMLGITDKYSPKEWIAESETELVANVHNIGDLFYIGETLYKVIADLNAGDAVNVGVNVEEVNANDILDDYATKEDVQDNVSIVEKSASGSIASFPDGADDIPLKSLVVNIDPVQDTSSGDPSPENICPISGWEGANITHFGKNCISNGAKRKSITTSLYAEYTPVVSLENATSVTFSVSANVPSGQTLKLYGWTGVHNTNIGTLNLMPDGRYALTGTNNIKHAKEFRIYSQPYTGGSSVITTVWDCTCVINEIRTDYIPYNGRTIPISWQSEAGTVYGGKLDVLSGELVIDRAMVDLGTLNWSKLKDNVFGTTNLVGQAKEPSTYNDIPDIICSHYISASYLNLWSEAKNNTVTIIWATSNRHGELWVRDSAYTDAATFKTAMDGVQLVYSLATPIEIQLTPHEVNSLLGINNIFADTGNTSVEYFSQVDEDLVDYIKANLNSYAKKDLLNDYVDDIQINGTSIVENGIAEIPFATSNTGGVVKIDSSLGIKLNDTNKLLINRATTTQTKAGIDAARPIVPICQHESVFYGLTKAAGVNMASSSNEVGTYTESAKSAISDMLNGAIQISGTDPTITAKSGIRYVCGEVLSLNFTPSANGICDVMFTSGSTPTVLTLPDTVKMPEWFIIEANTTYEINIADGIYGAVTSWTV